MARQRGAIIPAREILLRRISNFRWQAEMGKRILNQSQAQQRLNQLLGEIGNFQSPGRRKGILLTVQLGLGWPIRIEKSASHHVGTARRSH